MSKVQCFKLPAGSFISDEIFIVVDFSLGKMLGFISCPELRSIKKIKNVCFAYPNDEVDTLIIHLANKPVKIWEVEV